MSEKTQLIGISNAIVDVLTQVSMEFLKEMQIINIKCLLQKKET